jgi:Xaa-Pro aminopeptidase
MISIADFLTESSIDGVLLVSDSFCDQDLYYVSRFLATDRFAALVADKVYLLVNSMERGRAIAESSADHVESTSEYGIKDLLFAKKGPEEAYVAVLKRFLHAKGVKKLGMLRNAPAGIYRDLASCSDVQLFKSPFVPLRAVKSALEVDMVREVQRSCEQAMHTAIDMVCRSRPQDGLLMLDGSALTSEMVRAAVDISLVCGGCESVDNIVCGGPSSSNPHGRGSGPLPANAPIVIDLFPRSIASRYFADMTRTVLRGRADQAMLDLYNAVMRAQDRAIDAVIAGATGAHVHEQAVKCFAEMGYPQREGRGFIHSTGHGVGLCIHEEPSLSEVGSELKEGNIVTVEPGLYYPEVGGIRLEDLLQVTADGYENLTSFERRFVL